MKSSNRITLINIISTLVLTGISFFTSPVFSRLLGTDNYGIVSVYNAWLSIFTIVIGVQTVSSLAVARAEFGEERQKEYQSNAITISLLSFLCVGAGSWLARSPICAAMHLGEPLLAFMLLQSFGQYCVGFANTKFTYEFKAEKNFLLSLIVSISTVGLSLFLVNKFPARINYLGRILGMSIPYASIGAMICIWLLVNGKSFFHKEYWKFCIPLSLPIILHSLSGTVLGQSDRVMIQWSLGYSAVGIYSLAHGFSNIMSTIWGTLNNSWVPFYYDYTKNDQKEDLITHAKNYMELYTVLASGFLLLSREVYHIYAAEGYWEGTNMIPMFTGAAFMTFLYSFPVNYEFYHKKTKTIAQATLITAIINIGLNLVLIPAFGWQGAAIATLLSYSIQFLFHQYMAKHRIIGGYPFSFRLIGPYLVSFGISSFLFYILADFWWLRWSIGAIIGIRLLRKIIKRRAIF